MAKRNYKRLQFDFSKKAVGQLDALVEKTDSSSRAEVVRKAIRFYEYVFEMENDGYLAELKKGEERIILAPLLAA